MNDTMQTKRKELFVQVFAFALIVLVFLYATAQLVTPYIAHDDWDFLAPESWGLAYSSPWKKTLTEGRWLSYLWSQVSVYLTPRGSFLTFIASYFVLACAMTRQAVKSRLFVLGGLAIFFSPMLAVLSLWPTGMICSIVLSATAAWLIVKLDERYSASIVFAATFCLVLTYPPLAAVVLLTAALRKADASLWGKISLGIAYVLGFAAGTLLIYSLNLHFHGYFGVKIDEWRAPRTPHGLADLLANAALYVGYWKALLRAYTPAFVCGVLAAVLAIYRKETRNKAGAILLAAVWICGIELGITLVTGTVMPTRSAIWLWVVPCLLCMVMGTSKLLPYRQVGALLLLALTLVGAAYWWHLYRHMQPIAEYETQLATQIRQYETMTGIQNVEVMGEPAHMAKFKAAETKNLLQALQMSMRKRFGIQIEKCDMELCLKAKEYLASHEAQSTPLLVIDGHLLLVFDRSNTDRVYERNFPSEAQERALRLGYLPYVPYGREAVRLTPFFPGKSDRPLSIKLASSAHGYKLRFEDNKCAFPIDYELKDSSGAELGKGSVVVDQPAALPAWSDAAGIGILDLRMASDAKNNYGCGLVVSTGNQ